MDANKIKLSDHQVFALAANFTMGTSIIAVTATIADYAKQDAWLVALIAPFIGLPFIWIYHSLMKLHPGKTLIEVYYAVFGKFIGWILAFLFSVFVCFVSTPSVTFYIGNFVQTQYMTETPLYALFFIFVICLMVALLYGLEAVARSAEISVVIVSGLIIFAMLMNLPNIHPKNLMPVLEEGFTPIIKASIQLASVLTWPCILFTMFYPINTDNTNKTRNSLFFGYTWGTIINLIIVTMSVLVLGSTIASNSQYSTYLMAKEISLGVINRVEAIISFSWIVTETVRNILYFYAAAVGISRLFGISDYKKIILPLGLVCLVYAGVNYPDSYYVGKYDTIGWTTEIGVYGFVLPILMLIITKIKIKIGRL
ncbi:MAG: endospore germination permease [Clostridiales bacterium]|nr:endospore germination permease [Clostridiales bacterium]